MRLFIWLLGFFLCSFLVAQSPLPDSFVAQSEQYGLQWPALEQAEGKLKFYEPDPILDQSFALGIKNSKEKYRVLIFFKEEGTPPIPHIQATLKANHFSNNIEDTFVAIHTFLPEGLEKYQVDWGGVYYFTPKLALTETYNECQMVCLFKLGKGAVYIVYLFDEFSPEVEDMIWNPVFREVSEN